MIKLLEKVINPNILDFSTKKPHTTSSIIKAALRNYGNYRHYSEVAKAAHIINYKLDIIGEIDTDVKYIELSESDFCFISRVVLTFSPFKKYSKELSEFFDQLTLATT